MSALLCLIFLLFIKKVLKKIKKKLVDRLLKGPAGQRNLVKHLQNHLLYVTASFVVFFKGDFRFSMTVNVTSVMSVTVVGGGIKLRMSCRAGKE